MLYFIFFFFFHHVVYISFSFITKKSLIKKYMLIFCYIFFSQKTVNNSSFFKLAKWQSLFYNKEKNEDIAVQIRPIWKSFWWTRLKPLMSERGSLVKSFDLLLYYIKYIYILNRYCVADEYLHRFSTQIHNS